MNAIHVITKLGQLLLAVFFTAATLAFAGLLFVI
jgi:hypothetical protein